MTKNQNMIALYSRKSKMTGKGESIGNQIELGKDYVRAHFGDKAADQILIYEDEGFSGKNLNRPAFQRMMAAAKKRRFKMIIVYRLDRISRHVSDFSGLIDELSRLDIAFVSIREQFDTGTPMGRAMMYIASVFSQLERETIAERIRDNMHGLAKTGCWLGGTTPTGFASEAVESVTADGKVRKTCRLDLIPEEADIVRSIFELYQETDSLSMTEAKLLDRGVKTKKGNLFTRFSIKAILQNPVYMIADKIAYDFFLAHDTALFSRPEDFDGICGIMAYNRTRQEKGHSTVSLPPKEWIVSVGSHPGLIPGKMWVSIQESLEHNKVKAIRKVPGSEALLTGVLYCSCGSRMYPRKGRSKTPDGETTYSYVCRTKERSRKSLCSSRNLNGRLLDTAIIKQLKLLKNDEEHFLRQLEQSQIYYTGFQTEEEHRLSVLKKDLSGEYQDVEDRISQLESLISRHTLRDFKSDDTNQLLTILKEGLDDQSPAQKRAAIRKIVRKVVWDGVDAHVVLSGVRDDEYAYPEAASGAPKTTEDEDENLSKGG